MNKVSIVMTTYNGESYIKEQIESILSSDYKEFDINIYDDGSSDGTVSILKEYEKKYPKKIYVKQNVKNLGVTRNFLEGICNTRADYIMLCDQDDVWKSDKIALSLRKIEVMEESSAEKLPMAVFTDATVVNKDLDVINDSFFKSSRLDPYKTDLAHLLMENKLIGCTVMINSSLRDFLKSTSLPKNARFHDWWIGLIASSMGQVEYLDIPTLLYRQHEDNVVGNISFLSYIKDRVTSIYKQKDALLASQKQAREFYILYKDMLGDKERRTIRTFARLNELDFISRRVELFRYGFWKTGLIRKLGVFLII